MLNPIETENLEVELLVEAIYRRYGYNFRNYSRASLKRRMHNFLGKTEYGKLSEMIPRLLYDRPFFDTLLYGVSVPVTEMFRDPSVYRAIREKVVGILKTYPFIKVWHAGCATGEEAYSLAILLKEEGLYDRTRIYATDFNDEALDAAKKGIYPVDRIRGYTENYQKSGGKESFSDYYHSRYGSAIMNRDLTKNIVFANHNLASDAVFGETHFVMCRNVLIYFDRELQNRALRLFYDSLVYKGFLCLGTKETIQFSGFEDRFSVVDLKHRIYRKLETGNLKLETGNWKLETRAIMKEIDEMDVYRLSEELSDLVWYAYDKWCEKVQRSIGYQILKSADSIAANLAEGYGRYTPSERKLFYRYARGSFEETKAWLRKLIRRKIIVADETSGYQRIIEELGPKLNAFIKTTK